MLPAVAQCGSCALNVQTNRTHDLGPTAIRSRSGRYYGSSSHRGAGDSQPRAGLCRLVAPPVQQPQRQGSARMRRPPQAQSTAEESTKTSVLFVCLGKAARTAPSSRRPSRVGSYDSRCTRRTALQGSNRSMAAYIAMPMSSLHRMVLSPPVSFHRSSFNRIHPMPLPLPVQANAPRCALC